MEQQTKGKGRRTAPPEKSAYERVLAARQADRPGIRDFIRHLFEGFMELHGDRLYRDDPSILGGIGFFHRIPVTVIGTAKGRNTEENIRCNFGMGSPEGYRKVIRLMEQAEKFSRPVITFIDTPGAYPGLEAEMNGISGAIAECLACFARIRVPTIAFFTGEGGSGGALALGAADKVYMLENAVYSILSPEGFASILWKDARLAPKAAELMRLTAAELKEDGLVDGIIPEGEGLYANLERVLETELSRLAGMKTEALLKQRQRKYRRIDGLWQQRG